MTLELWGALPLAFGLGAAAALIVQFTEAKKGLEAGAKARTLRENVNSLVERNGARRIDLRKRQEVLDEYTRLHIEHQQEQLNAAALKAALEETEKQVESLRTTIRESENLIVENRRVLAGVERQSATSVWWLAALAVVIGGVTAVVFGLMGFLGVDTENGFSITTPFIMQSLLLGAAWPVVWERALNAEALDTTAANAIGTFQAAIREVEKEDV